MIGVVGKLRIEYFYSGKNHVDVFDLVDLKEFRLSACPDAVFTVDEVTYVIDTVYGVELSCGEESWYVSEPCDFGLIDRDLSGTMSLLFYNREKK